MKITGKQQRGVGLIEVMMALLVLAIGVLGYAGMQLTALKAAEDANNRSGHLAGAGCSGALSGQRNSNGDVHQC